MKIRDACLCLVGLFMIAACQANSSSEDNQDGRDTRQSMPAVQPETPGSITVEEMKRIYDSCDYVDVIFYESSVSMSQTDQSGIRRTIQFVSTRPATTNPGCSPIGRISFMIAGNIVTEADIYMGEGCNYFSFLRNGNVYAVNEMTPDGIRLFSKFLQAEPPGNG